MMRLEAAISVMLKRAAKLQAMIPANEASSGLMDNRKRAELGAIRTLLYEAGMARASLPEVPFLAQEHLDAYKALEAERKARRLGVAG